jgi:hypothetical protein
MQYHVGIIELLPRLVATTLTPLRSPSPLHACLRATPHLLDRFATELTAADHQPPLDEPLLAKP